MATQDQVELSERICPDRCGVGDSLRFTEETEAAGGICLPGPSSRFQRTCRGANSLRLDPLFSHLQTYRTSFLSRAVSSTVLATRHGVEPIEKRSVASSKSDKSKFAQFKVAV